MHTPGGPSQPSTSNPFPPMDIGFNTSSNPFENGGTPDGGPETQGKPERLDSFDKIFKEPNNQDVPASTNEGYPNWSEDPFAMHEAFPEPAT